MSAESGKKSSTFSTTHTVEPHYFELGKIRNPHHFKVRLFPFIWPSLGANSDIAKPCSFKLQSLTKRLEWCLISRRPPPPFQCCEEKRENMTHIRAEVHSSDPKCQINIERGEGGCWIFFLNLNVKQGVVRCAFQLLLPLIVFLMSRGTLKYNWTSLFWTRLIRNPRYFEVKLNPIHLTITWC